MAYLCGRGERPRCLAMRVVVAYWACWGVFGVEGVESGLIGRGLREAKGLDIFMNASPADALIRDPHTATAVAVGPSNHQGFAQALDLRLYRVLSRHTCCCLFAVAVIWCVIGCT